MPIDLVMDERDGEGKSRTDSIGSDDSTETRGNPESGQVKALLQMILLMLVILAVVSTCQARVMMDKKGRTDSESACRAGEILQRVYGQANTLSKSVMAFRENENQIK